ncbi:MAG: sugar porter family MFS transporter [Gammaproteobacteria bacterium]|nr:sugar porter family MFS transporter [Gammaproteobacteria bacterium]MDH3431349.1 sugar porter family MFS transporter [Gammaproteobacteria bacterium]MDH3433249.1 sugar porter family MFS transporter [Gammaproteobacteria bacterium]
MNEQSEVATDDGSTLYIIIISCIATIGGFLFGFDSGVINGTVDGLRGAFDSDSVGTGFNVASMLLGCAVGAYFAGRLADRFGRRSIMRVAAICFIVSAWGSGAAGASLEFVIYRVLGGLAVGAASVLAPAYISEVAPARYRGSLATVQQIAIISGLFVAFISNYLLAGFAGSSTEEFWLGFEAWRWMFWVEMLPATIFLIALLLIPESPRYLVLHRERDKALEVLTRLGGAAAAARKVDEIDASLAADHHNPRLKDLIDPRTNRIRRLVWVGIGLATLQQLVGINVVFYYGAVLWQSVGFTESDALLINVISGGLSIAAVTVTVLLIDKIGRKPILLIGSIGMAVSLATVVVAFINATTGSDGSLTLEGIFGPLALVAANVYVIFFNFSWGPVMWVMLGEMFPNQIRGTGLAVSGLAQWGSNFAITMTFPIMLASIGLAGAYGFYTLCAILSIVFVIRMVHETRGIELEDMLG